MTIEVAPLAGAWIEMTLVLTGKTLGTSHPSRVRGLKLTISLLSGGALAGRTPRGCVD